MLDVVEANPREVIGGNNPPDPTPFDLSREEIEGLFMEAKNWLDGDPILTQPQADEIGKIVDKLRKAKKTADERRKAENKPFDDGKAAVQAKYNPLIQDGRGKVDLALSVCKEALRPFLTAQEAEKRAVAERLRLEALAKQQAAQEALRASQAADLAKREEAERLVHEARQADRAATRAENDRASVQGGGRAITARVRFKAEITDRREAARFMWTECPDQFDDLLTRLGQDFVDAGRRALPGFAIREHTSIQ